jgi:hypothetical protein
MEMERARPKNVKQAKTFFPASESCAISNSSYEDDIDKIKERNKKESSPPSGSYRGEEDIDIPLLTQEVEISNIVDSTPNVSIVELNSAVSNTDPNSDVEIAPNANNKPEDTDEYEYYDYESESEYESDTESTETTQSNELINNEMKISTIGGTSPEMFQRTGYYDKVDKPFSCRKQTDGNSFVDKYLAQSRQANNGCANEEKDTEYKLSDCLQYPSGRSRFVALRQRQSRLLKSKSSSTLNDQESSKLTPFSSKYSTELAKSKSSHMLKIKNNNSEQPGNEYLTSWAKYLKEKYGTRKSEESTSNKLFSNCNIDTVAIEQRILNVLGKRGSQIGCFTWPRGIAVGLNNNIVVADSSNHRVQVFGQDGKFNFSFGKYGNGDGEFDCLAGVAVNRIGQYIIADRYNHRIQIFDPSGNFLRSFGSQGSSDGKFSYPWGIATDALGFIYVCDKENHRIQIFQSDGSFVGKFGELGKDPGLFNHPHYVTVSNTNRIIISDSNNHRIQMFDGNGKYLSTFGQEGTGIGELKFPRY